MNIARNQASFLWFAAHEIKLSLRDFSAMIAGGRRGRRWKILVAVIVFLVIMHLIAHVMIAPLVADGTMADKTGYLGIFSSMIILFSMMVSQTIESVTRAFFGRSDLDLILSSPIVPARLFAVRILTIAAATTALSSGLVAPVINVLAYNDHPGWLCAYLTMPVLGIFSTALSLSIVAALLKFIGAKRTRIIAQVIAAIVGAGFMIGLQIIALMSLGSISRFDLINADFVQQAMPNTKSLWWLPVRASYGDAFALLLLFALAALVLAMTLKIFAPRFAGFVLAAASVSETIARPAKARLHFRPRSVSTLLLAKELNLLIRDKWLISQSLMQLLYLVPPAFMLWQSYGKGGSMLVLTIPILVMAAGQLAGGLAWLSISGEEAPQLVRTAPIRSGTVLLAKIKAVLVAIALITLPFALIIGWSEPRLALTAMAGILAASIGSILIQFWFRTQANRNNFRKRQTASRLATVCEAFSSVMWAGMAGLFAVQSLLALFLLALGALVLLSAWYFRPDTDAQAMQGI